MIRYFFFTMNNLLILILSTLFTIPVIGQSQSNLVEELNKILLYEYDVEFEDKEGIWIGVIDEDSTFIFSIGNIELDSLSVFQLGSLSKVFTHQLISELTQKAGVSPDTSITAFIELDESFENITLNDLMSHQSGLPKHPYFMGRLNNNPNNPYSDYPDEILLDEMNNYTRRYMKQIKKDHLYSHLNAALLGLIAQQIGSADYCELIEDEFQDKFPSLQCSDTAPITYGYNNLGQLGKPWTFPGFASSEGLASNLIDLISFVKSEMIKPQSGSEIIINKELKFQAPWYVTSGEKKDLIYNFSGRTDIHSSYLCFNPNKKTGVVLLRNSGKGIQGIPHSLLHLISYGKKKNKKYNGKK